MKRHVLGAIAAPAAAGSLVASSTASATASAAGGVKLVIVGFLSMSLGVGSTLAVLSVRENQTARVPVEAPPQTPASRPTVAPVPAMPPVTTPEATPTDSAWPEPPLLAVRDRVEPAEVGRRPPEPQLVSPPSARPAQRAPEPPRVSVTAPLDLAPDTPPVATGASSGGPVRRPAEEPAASLALEVELLQEAEAALRERAFARALAALGRYRAEHATGVLLVESQVLEVLALCGLERPLDAARVASNITRSTDNPALHRLAASCVDPR